MASFIEWAASSPLIYENDDRRLEAYRFGSDGGHYDGEGRPLRKLFLRSPLRYSRVTSGFSSRRFHPVLKQYRPRLWHRLRCSSGYTGQGDG